MVSKQWLQLQNGSDIRGIALEGVPGQHVNLTGPVIQSIASAFVVWLSRRKNKPASELTISIGTDSRLSAEFIKDAAIKGLISSGCSAVDCGMASTPAMFMSTVTPGYRYDGAVMVTASHLPYNRNGLKFFTNEGGLEKDHITDILSIAESENFIIADTPGKVSFVDFISVYAEGLVKKIREEINHPVHMMEPLKGFRIVVDAGNGAGGFFAGKVLIPLGADTTGSQFLEPDGRFPNHTPNPEDKEAMDAISRAVVENGADLGIIFDADVDRAGAVGNSGMEYNRNRLIALLAAIILEEHPGSVVVTDSVTSTGLKRFIEEMGGVHHRFKRGYKNVINEAIRLNKEGRECHLAMETSGHGALKENYFLDDGAYLITKILVKMAKLKLEGNGAIDSLIEKLSEPVESKEFRMNILVENFKDYGKKIIEDLGKYAENEPGWKIAPDNYEGIRVAFDRDKGDGWFLLRLSLHDPLMPLNIESDSKGGVKIIASSIQEFLDRYEHLDTGSLKKHILS